MKVIYTTRMTVFEEGFAYRNPKFFGSIIPNAKHVTVEGSWPAVVDAYKAAGISVESKDKESLGSDLEVTEMGLPALRKHLKALGVEFDPKATKDELLALLPLKE